VKTHLYLGPGGNRIVFTLGFLDNAHIAPSDIQSVTAASASGFFAAYNHAGQREHAKKLFFGLQQRELFTPDGLINTQYLCDEVAKHPFSEERIRANPAPLYIKLFNDRTEQVEHLDLRKEPDMMAVLRAAISIPPYIKEPVMVNGEPYRDAAYYATLGLADLRARAGNNKLLLVLTNPERSDDSPRYAKVSADLMAARAPEHLPAYNARGVRDEAEFSALELLSNDPGIVVIRPPVDFPVGLNTHRSDALRVGYTMGMRAGRAYSQFAHAA
jgi:predicted patatin/cPLA2 family phospholipase